MPAQTAKRCLRGKTETPFAVWLFNNKCQTVTSGKDLRVEVLSPAVVHWKAGARTGEVPARDTGLGVYAADLPARSLPVGTGISFMFHWTESDRWEGTDYGVVVGKAAVGEKAAG